MNRDEIIEKINKKINATKADIKCCMEDYERSGEVSSAYPIGETHKDHSKSEVYHRGVLLGLEKALELLNKKQ